MFGAPELLVAGSALSAVPVVTGVVGVVFFCASGAGALVEAPTKLGSPAREDAPDRPVVGAGDFTAVRLGVGCPVRPQDVCEWEGHLVLKEVTLWTARKREGGESFACLTLANGGEVEVDEGGLEATVAEVGGELVELDAALKHVGGVAVTQGVAAEVIVLFIEAALRFGEVDGGPDTGLAHRFLVVVKGLPQGDPGGLPATSDAREEPIGIAVDFPEGTESLEEFGSEGNFAPAPAFGVLSRDTNDASCGVDVFWSDLGGL